MKYMIMVLSNPSFEQRWQELTDEQRDGFGTGHLKLTRELRESGELIGSEGLVGPEAAKRVTSRAAETTVTDGPFAEVKEHLAGFYLVDVDDEQRAIDIAARVPDAFWGLVEVRPILDTSQWDV